MASAMMKGVRGYSTSGKEGVKKLSNGLRVCSVPGEMGTLRVSLLGGSRYEKYDNLGVSHALRRAGGLSSEKCSRFGLTRELQQSGANLTVSQGREIFSYSLEFHRSFNEKGILDYFLEGIGNQAFKPWEVSDVCGPAIARDLRNQSLPSAALDLLHKAAFREGIGNTVYCPEFMVGRHSSDVIQGFFHKNFVPERTALVGVGIPLETLSQLGEKLSFDDTNSLPLKGGTTTYYGGELRKEISHPEAHVFVATQGPSLKDPLKDRYSSLLLQRILGLAPRVKRGIGRGKLAQTVKGSAAASAISCMYSDAGLFGVYIVCSDSTIAGDAVRDVVKVLRTMNISDAEVNAAKKNVLADLSEKLLSPSRVSDLLDEQILLGKEETCLSSFEEFKSILETVTPTDVKVMLKKVSGGKLSMGATGNLEHVPHLDEL